MPVVGTGVVRCLVTPTGDSDVLCVVSVDVARGGIANVDDGDSLVNVGCGVGVRIGIGVGVGFGTVKMQKTILSLVTRKNARLKCFT